MGKRDGARRRCTSGNAQGMFILIGDEHRREWRIDSLTLDGWAVYHAMADPRDGVRYAASGSRAASSSCVRHRRFLPLLGHSLMEVPRSS
jgi:hypothetical protein